MGGLRFPLIADPEAVVAKAYDTFKEDWKVSTRGTVIIGEDGIVLKVYPEAPLDGRGHAEAVFYDIEQLL